MMINDRNRYKLPSIAKPVFKSPQDVAITHMHREEENRVTQFVTITFLATHSMTSEKPIPNSGSIKSRFTSYHPPT